MKRNRIGIIVAFMIGVFLNGLATIIMILRELYQSKKYNFAIETNDVVNYSIASSVGSIVNVILILSFV